MLAKVDDKKSKREDEIAQIVCREYDRMSGNRGNWNTHWQEIAERIVPSQKNLFTALGVSTQGEKRTEFIYDSTASNALNRFGSIIDSLITPRNQTWHRLMASDSYLNKNREVKLWFEEVNRILFKYRYAPRANFASQNQQVYKSLGAYGTSAMFIDDLQTGDIGLRYRNIHLSELYLDENHQGIIDKVIRYFRLSLRQAAQKWGMEQLPDGLQTKLKVNPEEEVYFLHCVKPNSDQMYGVKDARGMPFVSHWVSVEGKKLMLPKDGQPRGYSTFPYATSRYEQTDGEVYGRSPAMEVLPAIKTLNEEKKTILKQGHRTVDPILLVHDDGIVDTFSMRPGALNPGGVDAQGRALVHALPVGNIAIGKELMDDERQVINDAFLVSLFQILVETPQMTATEVMERTREKGILLAPTIGRQQSEYLGPMIERELDILAQLHMPDGRPVLPPMPPILLEAQGEYRVEYDSPLSRAQRAEEASGLMRTVETTLNIVNVTQNPEPLDHFNWDVIIPEVSEIQGVPARWMRAAEEVQAIREDRAQQAQTQTAIQAAPGAAALVKADAVAQKGA